MTRRTLLLAGAVVVVVLAAGVGFALRGRTSLEAAAPPQALGRPVPLEDRVAPGTPAPLPARTLEGFAGGPAVDLTDYLGRPLVINFWATWCDPCVKEMPVLNDLAAQYEGRVAFLGVDVMDAPSRAQPFVEELAITYDLAVDADADLFDEVGAFAMPTTLLVDPGGTIVHRVTGEVTAGQLRDLLRDELAVPT